MRYIPGKSRNISISSYCLSLVFCLTMEAVTSRNLWTFIFFFRKCRPIEPDNM